MNAGKVRDVAREIVKGHNAVGSVFRLAKVTSVAAGPPRTATLDIGGVTVSSVRMLDHVHPVVDEGVWFMDTGSGQWIIVGTNNGTAIRSQYLLTAGDTATGDIRMPGLLLNDTNNSHTMRIICGSDLTADRVLTITPGNASRTLTLSASVALNQNVRTTDSPTFKGPLTISQVLSPSDGGQIDIQGGDNGAGTDYPTWSIDSYTNLFRITNAGTSDVFLAINEYGQVTLGPSASTAAWTNGTRGVAGFSQAALTVIEDDANSNAHLSLRHTNVGTSVTDGVDLVITRADGAALLIQRKNANLTFRTNDTNRVVLQNDGHFRPSSDNAYTCGASGLRWSAVWAANGTIQTSDERSKTDIQPSALGLDFIARLQPVSYKFKVGGNVVTYDDNGRVITDEEGNPVMTPVPGKRTHYGFVAQQVQEALGDTDFGGWIKTDLSDNDSEQGLRYEEFIAPLVMAVQQLKTQVDELRAQLESR